MTEAPIVGEPASTSVPVRPVDADFPASSEVPESRPNETPRTRVLRLLTEAGTLAIAVPALLGLLGLAFYRGEYQALGLHDFSALPEPTWLVLKGLMTITVPLLLFSVARLGIATLSGATLPRVGKIGPIEAPWAVSIIAASLAWLLVEVIRSRQELGVATWRLVLPVVSLLAMLGAVVVDRGRKAPATKREPPISAMVVAMAVLVVGTLVAASWVAGAGSGERMKKTCGSDLPGVQIAIIDPQISPVPFDKRFHLVAHEDGYLYIRDPNLGPNRTAVHAIPDDRVLMLNHVPVEREPCEED